MVKQHKDSSDDFERALTEKDQVGYLLLLYVSGMTPRSVAAITNIKNICVKNLKNRYEIEIIDTLQKPQMVKEDHILALPTLIKKLPLPLRRIIGDLSDTDRVLVALDLVEKA